VTISRGAKEVSAWIVADGVNIEVSPVFTHDDEHKLCSKCELNKFFFFSASIVSNALWGQGDKNDWSH
jgi:hypothetical protein